MAGSTDLSFETAIPDELRDLIQAGTLAYRYRGVKLWKNPFDLALYASLIWDTAPKTIIEIGSNTGGSALWFADIMKSYGRSGLVVSVDSEDHLASLPPTRDLLFLQGDGQNLSPTLDYLVPSLPRPIMLVEDADHRPETTAAVLAWWHRHSIPSEYAVIEDGNAEAMYPGRHGGGPLVAVHEFMAQYGDKYIIDRKYTDHFGRNVTFCPDGYIKRVSP